MINGKKNSNLFNKEAIKMFNLCPVPALAWQRVGKDFTLLNINNSCKDFQFNDLRLTLGIKASDYYKTHPEILENLHKCHNRCASFSEVVKTKNNKTMELNYFRFNYNSMPPDLVVVSIMDITKNQILQEKYNKLRHRFEESRKSLEKISNKGEIINKYESIEIDSYPDDLFKAISDQSVIGITITQDWKFNYVNQEFSRITEYSISEILDWKPKWFFNIILPQDQEKVIDIFEKKYRGIIKDIKNLQFRIIKKSGSINWVEISSRTIRYNEGEADLSIIKDINEPKEVAQKLIESEERFRKTFEQAAVGIAHVDPKGKFIRLNQRFCEIVGYSREELRKIQFSDITHPEDVEEDVELFNKMLRKELQNVGLEKRYIKKDGSIVWVKLTVALLFKENGEPNYFVSVAEDITKRKEIEDKFKLEKQFTEDLINTTSDTIFLFNPKTKRAIRWNDSFRKISGYTNEEIASLTTPDAYYNEEDLKKASVNTEEIINKGEATLELSLITKNGQSIPFEYSARRYKSRTGEDLILAFGRDVTERKQTQEALKKSEERYRLISENSGSFVWVTDMNLNLTYVGPSVQKILGFKVEEALKLPLRKRMTKKSIKIARTILKEEMKKRVKSSNSFATTSTFEAEHLHKDGTIIPIEITFTIIRDKNNKPHQILGLSRDIRERINAEENIRRERDIFERISEMSPTGIMMVNKDGEIIFSNPQAEKTLALSKSEIVGRLYNAPSWKITDFEGNPFPEEQLPFVVVQKERSPVFNIRHAIEKKNDERIYLSINASPLFDMNNEFDGMIATVEDITKKLMSEKILKESEKKYREAFERGNFYKDLFTHDINNIMQVIRSSIELISYQLVEVDNKELSDLNSILGIVDRQVIKAQKLIREVNMLSELEQKEKPIKTIEMSSILKDSITTIKSICQDKSMNINLNCDIKQIYVQANELLKDVFDNILTNAVKYNESEEIQIEVNVTEVSEKDKKFVGVEFVDNGIGISNDRKDLIFKRGHRKHKGQKGMGIGLSLVHKIIETYNGKIWVENRIPKDYSQGSRFMILIPVGNIKNLI
ncbi:MAG: PAS domain S-box protein [Candidatus Lokiarchaeota archaeon]|nr:PAS domain S-box protein [Candidatus Lokiarchaeota archaeon]MBD3339800.1 PAS domain S-box protein [Candidatus Lokiarchaeota archaeon]